MFSSRDLEDALSVAKVESVETDDDEETDVSMAHESTPEPRGQTPPRYAS